MESTAVKTRSIILPDRIAGHRVTGVNYSTEKELYVFCTDDGKTHKVDSVDIHKYLLGKSEETIVTPKEIDEVPTEDMISLAERVVTLSLKIAKFNGRFGSVVKNKRFFKGLCFSDTLTQIGEEAFTEQEPFKPAGLHISPTGKLSVLMQVPEEFVTELDAYHYAGLSLGQLEDSFPEVYDMIDTALEGESVSVFFSQIEARIKGKSGLINTMRDYLAQSRVTVVSAMEEQKAEDAVSHYHDDPGFGIF